MGCSLRPTSRRRDCGWRISGSATLEIGVLVDGPRQLRSNVTFPNTCYVALAETLGCPLITGVTLRIGRTRRRTGRWWTDQLDGLDGARSVALVSLPRLVALVSLPR